MSTEALTKTESQTLASYEVAIKQGLETFVEVGTAFAAIRDGRLYRETHDTFEDYCHKRWMLSRSYVNRVIAAAGVVNAIDAQGHQATLPESERQARPLASLPQEERAEAWNEAVEESVGQPTAAKVQEVVDRRKSTASPQVARETSADELTDSEDVESRIDNVLEEIYINWQHGTQALIDSIYRAVRQFHNNLKKAK